MAPLMIGDYVTVVGTILPSGVMEVNNLVANVG
jgi:hypothetical protein